MLCLDRTGDLLARAYVITEFNHGSIRWSMRVKDDLIQFPNMRITMPTLARVKQPSWSSFFPKPEFSKNQT